MVIVTGGAGFIGSNLVRKLNERGIDRILVVDHLDDTSKFRNLAGCRFADYMDQGELLARIESGKLDAAIDGIFHQGACADTMELNGAFMMVNNFSYSKALLAFALARKTPFVYASSAAVYGGSTTFTEDLASESPLNVYAFSKWAFDQHVRSFLADAESTVAGLRYFNVYGPNESHKGRMASVVHQFARQIAECGTVRLFGETDGHAAGEQRRDFIFVQDVIDVNLFFAAGPVRKGIFNVGTGESRTFNAVARAVISAVGAGSISYIPFPKELSGRYQSYTQADLRRLRAAGYQQPFTPLEQGVALTLRDSAVAVRAAHH